MLIRPGWKMSFNHASYITTAALFNIHIGVNIFNGMVSTCSAASSSGSKHASPNFPTYAMWKILGAFANPAERPTWWNEFFGVRTPRHARAKAKPVTGPKNADRLTVHLKGLLVDEIASALLLQVWEAAVALVYKTPPLTLKSNFIPKMSWVALRFIPGSHTMPQSPTHLIKSIFIQELSAANR